MTVTEKRFEGQVKRWFRTMGIYQDGTPIQRMKEDQVGWFVKIWGGGFQKSGIPDVIAVINGIFFSIELKSSNGEPSDLQEINTIRINRSNGIGVILYPEGFEEFKQLVEGVLKCSSHIQELTYLKETHSSSSCDILTD